MKLEICREHVFNTFKNRNSLSNLHVNSSECVLSHQYIHKYNKKLCKKITSCSWIRNKHRKCVQVIFFKFDNDYNVIKSLKQISVVPSESSKYTFVFFSDIGVSISSRPMAFSDLVSSLRFLCRK